LRVPVAAPEPFERGSAVAASVPDDLRRRWERALVNLKPVSPTAQGLCNSCQFLGLEQQTVVLSARGNRFVMEKLNEPRTRGMVEKVVAEVFGAGTGVRCDLQAAEPPAEAPRPARRNAIAEAASEPTVRAAMEVLGAQIERVLPPEDGRAG
jgi:hypothetical protein